MRLSKIRTVAIFTWLMVALSVQVPMLVLAQSGQDQKTTSQVDPAATSADPNPHIANDIPVEGDDLQGVPLTVGGVEIVRFKGTISGFTPQQRVSAILYRLHELDEIPSFKIDSITTKETNYSTDIVAGDNTIFTITDRDARLIGQASRQVVATECAIRLKSGLLKIQEAKNPKVILMASIFTAVSSSF